MNLHDDKPEKPEELPALTKEQIGDVKLTFDDPNAPIKLCQEHWDRLAALLETQDKVNAAFHGLTSLVLQTIGSEGVVALGGCPICAVQKFDFIGEMAKVLTTEKPRIMLL